MDSDPQHWWKQAKRVMGRGGGGEGKTDEKAERDGIRTGGLAENEV